MPALAVKSKYWLAGMNADRRRGRPGAAETIAHGVVDICAVGRTGGKRREGAVEDAVEVVLHFAQVHVADLRADPLVEAVADQRAPDAGAVVERRPIARRSVKIRVPVASERLL